MSVFEFHPHLGRGADEPADQGFDLLTGLRVDLVERFSGKGALAGFVIDLFARPRPR